MSSIEMYSYAMGLAVNLKTGIPRLYQICEILLVYETQAFRVNQTLLLLLYDFHIHCETILVVQW